MNCASTDNLLTFAQGALPREEAQSVRLHLAGGCEECNKQLRQIQKVLSVAETPGLLSPPDWLKAEAMNLFGRLTSRRNENRNPGLQAVLLVDTGAEARLLGFRGTAPMSRHLLYRAGDYDIDLSIDCIEQTRKSNIIGQSMPLEQGLEVVADSSVELLSDSVVTLATKTNEFGEFILEGIREGVYDLKLTFRDGEIYIPELNTAVRFH